MGTLEDVDLDKQLSGDWNLFDEIATHFRQVDEYQDMVHIFVSIRSYIRTAIFFYYMYLVINSSTYVLDLLLRLI